MIEIEGKIVSADLLREKFACDLSQCKGACCIEGDAGAPLEIEEVDILEEEYENYKPYMTEEGKAYLIEVNSIPGMSSGSIVPKQARTAGISLGELYDLVIEDTKR